MHPDVAITYSDKNFFHSLFVNFKPIIKSNEETCINNFKSHPESTAASEKSNEYTCQNYTNKSLQLVYLKFGIGCKTVLCYIQIILQSQSIKDFWKWLLKYKCNQFVLTI